MKTIEEMAREASASMLHGGEYALFGNTAIEAFAALVRADERKRIITANAPEIEKNNAHIKMLEDEIAVIRSRGNT